MNCAWNKLLDVLPQRLRTEVDRLGREDMQELRLRINAPPELIFSDRFLLLNDRITMQDLSFVVNSASRYSPWAAGSIAKGYISISGGHRIGICGDVVCRNGTIGGIQTVTSLCIRVARDFVGIADKGISATDSILIVGAPGWGKTTLLRDLIRKVSISRTTAVVDERGELFTENISTSGRIDILKGCTKAQGIEILLRTMGPEYIAVDEITAEEDAYAVLQAANCGVKLLATCHGSSIEDLKQRNVYRILMERNVFRSIFLLKQNKSYIVERIHA